MRNPHFLAKALRRNVIEPRTPNSIEPANYLTSSEKFRRSTAPRVASEIQKFRLPTDPNHLYIPHRPVPIEGRFAIVTDAGRDAVDAAAQLTNSAEAYGEVVSF
jgi:hypothetical protein